MNRGLPYAEAMKYVGVKRRTFDEQWRPRLVAMQQGACLIFDRADLDRLFDEFKAAAAGEPQAANDAVSQPAQNGARNGRPATEKGVETWAKQPGASTRMEKAGRSTRSTEASDFASAVSLLRQRRKAG